MSLLSSVAQHERLVNQATNFLNFALVVEIIAKSPFNTNLIIIKKTLTETRYTITTTTTK